jgi:hypothetical protein
MIDIMNHFSKYVPSFLFINVGSAGETVQLKSFHHHQILFGGDQLTCAQARSAQKNVVNGNNALSGLDGLISVVEDWHAQLNLLNVSDLLVIH